MLGINWDIIVEKYCQYKDSWSICRSIKSGLRTGFPQGRIAQIKAGKEIQPIKSRF